MKLIFVRHGQAAPYCDDDAHRDLTEFGRMQAHQTAEYICQQHPMDLIIASPYNRADQTAKILLQKANDLGRQPQFITLGSITPDDEPKQALKDIDRIIVNTFGADVDDKCIAIVCHMPIVGYMTADVLGQLPSSFALAECRVLSVPAAVAGFGTLLGDFVPVQP